MVKRQEKTKKLREFILTHVTENPKTIGAITAKEFGISRQAVSRHLKALIEEGLLSATGYTSNRIFRLRERLVNRFFSGIDEDAAEDVMWTESVEPSLAELNLKKNVLGICEYGFTEMMNNVISHSQADDTCVSIRCTAVRLKITVSDTGIGIFKKIQDDFNLSNPLHALFELSKGKLTSDKSNHSGEGIFFTSKMFDSFSIWSGNLFFAKFKQRNEGWLTETDGEREFFEGTQIGMEISFNSERAMREVFEEYAAENTEWSFSKTHLLLNMLRHEGGNLLSRSKAKRLLARMDQFKEVVLDFKDISYIGQAFADQVFRVFRSKHPEVLIHAVNTTEDIDKMIARVTLHDEPG